MCKWCTCKTETEFYIWNLFIKKHSYELQNRQRYSHWNCLTLLRALIKHIWLKNLIWDRANGKQNRLLNKQCKNFIAPAGCRCVTKDKIFFSHCIESGVECWLKLDKIGLVDILAYELCLLFLITVTLLVLELLLGDICHTCEYMQCYCEHFIWPLRLFS